MLDTYGAHVIFGDGECGWHGVYEVWMESAHFFQLKNIKYSSMEVLAIKLNLPSFATLI